MRTLFLALLVTVPAFAADSTPPPRSVYHIAPRIDAPVIAVTAVGIVVPYAWASSFIQPRCPGCLSRDEVNAFDRGAIGNDNRFLDHLSDATLFTVLLTPPLLDYLDVGQSRAFVEDLTVYVETLSVNGALTTLAKYTVQRPLPRVYAGQDAALAASPGGYRSFYSGHVSHTVSALSATAMTHNYRHGFSVRPWAVTAGLGAAVAYERVAAGRHFPTDVIVGALAGAVVGVGVPWLHAREDTALSNVGLSVSDDSYGLSLVFRLR